MGDPQGTSYTTRPAYRVVGAVLGVGLLLIGGYVLVSQPLGALEVAASVVILALGGNLLLSACRGTESWLAKIGPLP